MSTFTVAARWVDFPFDPIVTERALGRIESFFLAWNDTPYRPGQMVPGVGVDCLRLLAAFGMWMERRSDVVPERLPQDVAFHRPELARAAIRRLMENFPLWERVEIEGTPRVQPGDLLVVGPPGIPSHGMLASHRRNVLLHAAPGGVQPTGLSMDASTSTIHSIYRSAARRQWGAAS